MVRPNVPDTGSIGSMHQIPHVQVARKKSIANADWITRAIGTKGYLKSLVANATHTFQRRVVDCYFRRWRSGVFDLFPARELPPC